MAGLQEYEWNFVVGPCCAWFIAFGECSHLNDEEHDELKTKVDAMDSLLEDFTIIRWKDTIQGPGRFQSFLPKEDFDGVTIHKCQCCGEEHKDMYTVTAIVMEHA